MAQSNLYITTQQAADHLGVSTSWLEKLRVSGFGPPYFKPSDRLVLYRRSEIDAWISSSRRTSTSDLAEPLEVDK